ncbi:DUF2259 domain-containing protein [Devosia sp.]|uniref:DUF2259 domain-containing protein n=1 Tax=Devosia sp. TaxID=1871048 RepID=UPI003264B5D3
MKPNAALKAMARLAVSLGLVAASAMPAWAGDRAQFGAIGYDEGGHYLAFEEFGIGDGSGLPYSNIYVVDLQKDSWVLGTPIKVQAVDESETLLGIRAKSLGKVQTQLSELGINAPAELIAQIGDGLVGNDGANLRFGLPSYTTPGAIIGDYGLKLTSFEATASVPCADWFGTAGLGYKLLLTGDGADRVIHLDDKLPRSRGCPMAYRLYGVLLPPDSDSVKSAVAIVSVYTNGFEGPDRRFLAIPLAAQ